MKTKGFVNLEEAFPKKDGLYKVMVNSIEESPREAKAKWTNDDGFKLQDSELGSDEFIASWWIQ